MSNIPILDDDAVGEIEAQGHSETCAQGLYSDSCNCGKVERDALCATVRALRADVVAMQREFDSYSQRIGTEKADLQSQLDQVTKERDRLKEDLRILTQGRFIQS